MEQPSAESVEKLPLSETTFYILLALAPAPKHGYAIMKEVSALSDGRIALSTGTLYGALKRLLEAGWIEPVRERGVRQSARPRRAYALTDLGRRVLNGEIERLQSLVKAARRHIPKGAT